jgi:hypothetical protein
MKIILKIILLSITLSSILTQDSGVLFDIIQMQKDGTIRNFLQLKDDGYPVSTELCMENPTFKITQKAVQPASIIKGGSIRVIAGGLMIKDQVIQKIHLDTYFNGQVIYTQEVDKKNVSVPKGKWQWDYEASIPSFTPTGHWEIFFWIINDANEKISCLKGIFDTN